LAAEAAEVMEHYRITSVLVTSAQGALIGMVTVGDLMRAKVI
jgi:arabinose-5-phosphate isomerase